MRDRESLVATGSLASLRGLSGADARPRRVRVSLLALGMADDECAPPRATDPLRARAPAARVEHSKLDSDALWVLPLARRHAGWQREPKRVADRVAQCPAVQRV